MPILTATVRENKTIAIATKEVILETAPPFTFQPGQYVTFLVPTPDGKKLGRSYSIASRVDDQRIVLVVKIVDGGLGSTYIDGWKEGDQVEYLGPLGRFLLQPVSAPLAPTKNQGENQGSQKTNEEEASAHQAHKGGRGDLNYLFVATGTGVAPFVPMIDALLKRPPSAEGGQGGSGGILPKITFLLGFRHEEDSFYREIFEDFAAEHPNLRFVCCLSQPPETWTGGKGRVTAYLQEHPELAADTQIYICGNGSMITEVADIAASHGVPRERIFFEKYNNL